MNVKEAVKDKANYYRIVTYFKNLKTLSMDDMVRLVDVIEVMSEEIFEHYKALCDMCRDELQKISRIYREEKNLDFLEDSQKRQLAYILSKACGRKILLAEKYEDMAEELDRYL